LFDHGTIHDQKKKLHLVRRGADVHCSSCSSSSKREDVVQINTLKNPGVDALMNGVVVAAERGAGSPKESSVMKRLRGNEFIITTGQRGAPPLPGEKVLWPVQDPVRLHGRSLARCRSKPGKRIIMNAVKG